MAHATTKSATVNCLNCPIKVYSEEELLNHVRIHEHEANFKIPCMFCPQKMKSIRTYRKHRQICNQHSLHKEMLRESDAESQKESLKESDAESQCYWQCQNCSHSEVVNFSQGSSITA